MVEEIGQKEQKEEVKTEVKTEPSEPVKSSDNKVAEIWIREGRVMLDACPEFYHNKLMAVGILEYCKDIVKNTNYAEKPKIQVASGLGSIRNFLNKRKKH